MESVLQGIQGELATKNEEILDNKQNERCNSNGDNTEDYHAATFEEAISSTGLGKYSVMLILVLIFPTTSQLLETGSLSYVLPKAQCDLNITLEDFGIIMSMTHLGMIASGFFWGYLSDAYGRKKVLVCGYLLNAGSVVMAAFSTSSTLLVISKVCGGLVIGGPFSTAMVHTSEFFKKEYRGTAKLMWGVMGSIGNMALPLLAWLILPNNWTFTLGGHAYHTWNIFLLICAMVPLTGGITYSFMQESPKYLMSSGNNRRAMKVFQKIYTINTGKQKNTYPHQYLAKETNSSDDMPMKRSAAQLMVKALRELKFLLRKPYTSRILLACTVAFSLSSSFTTMRMWLPQMFKAINDYQLSHNGTSTDICVVLRSWREETENRDQSCNTNTDDSPAYIKSCIVALTTLVIYLIATIVIKYVGSKRLVRTTVATFLLTGGIYFAQSSTAVLIASSLSDALGNVSTIMFVSITVEMFPTSLRTIALALHHTSARMATLTGNMLFPFLLEAGCVPTFSFVALGPLVAGLLSLLYPDVDNKPLM